MLYFSRISAAFSIEPLIPNSFGVNINCAPYALIILRLSILMLSGMIITAFIPKTEAKIATAIPVLPLVGSTMIVSLLTAPLDIASSSIPSTALSLTLPPRLYFSNFTKIFVLSS